MSLSHSRNLTGRVLASFISGIRNVRSGQETWDDEETKKAFEGTRKDFRVEEGRKNLEEEEERKSLEEGEEEEEKKRPINILVAIFPLFQKKISCKTLCMEFYIE